MSGFSIRSVICTLVFAGALTVAATQIQAQEILITYSNQKFEPAEIRAPADKPFTFRVKNAGAKAMEFESKTLKVEKVVAGASDATINVRAQKAGRYEFFDEYNEKVARGALVVK